MRILYSIVMMGISVYFMAQTAVLKNKMDNTYTEFTNSWGAATAACGIDITDTAAFNSDFNYL